MYDLLLTLHVVAAVLWVGGGATMHILGRRTLRSGDPRRIVAFAADANWLGPRFYSALSLVLLVAGIFLVEEAGYEHSQTWVVLGLAGWVVSFVIGVGFYARHQKRLEATVAVAGPEAPAVVANVQRMLQVNAIELLILLAIVVDMAVKPGL